MKIQRADLAAFLGLGGLGLILATILFYSFKMGIGFGLVAVGFVMFLIAILLDM